MALGRRKIALADQARWVFNRIADAYDARPPYPDALVDAIAHSAPGKRVLDVGAGIGHLAIPLAVRGFLVSAVEPAGEMLAQLEQRAAARAVQVTPVHAQAEALPLAGPFDLLLIADALHFVDAERTGQELARVRASHCALAIVRAELADTPYMNALVALMHESAPRRLRKTTGNAKQIAALAGVTHVSTQSFDDHHPLAHAELMRLLATISFIGPAMNEAVRERFDQRVRALGPAVWSRHLTLEVSSSLARATARFDR